MNNPHDKFFKKSIAWKDTAEGFLQHYLPQELLDKIDLTTLEIDKDSFTDDELEEFFLIQFIRQTYQVQKHIFVFYLNTKVTHILLLRFNC